MNGPRWSIRRTQLDDEAAVTRLWVALQREQGKLHEVFTPSDDAERRWANDFGAWVRAEAVRGFFVAVVDGDVVGFAMAEPWYPAPVYRPASEVFLSALYVDASHRRAGIGGALVEAVRDWARGRHADRIRLRVAAGNSAAEGFWKAQQAEVLSRTLAITS